MLFYFDVVYILVGVSVLLNGWYVIIVIKEKWVICDKFDIMFYYI